MQKSKDEWDNKLHVLERVYGIAAATEARLDRAAFAQVARLPGGPPRCARVSDNDTEKWLEVMLARMSYSNGTLSFWHHANQTFSAAAQCSRWLGLCFREGHRR